MPNSTANQTPRMPAGQPQGLLGRINEHINWPASIAATLALSALANYEIYGRHHQPGSTMRHVETALTYKDHRTIENTSQPTIVTKDGSRYKITPIVSKTLLKSTIHNPSERWAEEFAADPHAGELTHQQDFQTILHSIKSLADEGFDIGTITVTGFSSAEDDGPNAGLSTPSPKNIQLAQRRAQVVADDLKAAFQKEPLLKKATESTVIKFGEPQEQSLTHETIDKLRVRAKKDGFASLEDMIKTWNRTPQDVPEADRQALDSILASARKVDITVASKHPSTTAYREDKYCVIREVSNEQITTVHKTDNEPFPAIIPLPIPRIRRKGETDAEDASDPEDGKVVPIRPDLSDGTGAAEGSSGTAAPKTESLDEYLERMNHGRWRRRAIGASIGSLAAGLLLLINVSGEGCDNKIHSPWPFPVEMVASIFGHKDQEQKISIGIPFVKSLQLVQTGMGPGLFLTPEDIKNGCKAAPAPNAPKAGAPAPQPCEIIQIQEHNGKVVSRQVVQPGTIISSKIVKTK